MPRGGRRAGAPGKSYGNRTDLTQNKTLPMAAATGQPYGVRAEQMAAQRALPVAPPPSPSIPSSNRPNAAPAPGPGGPQMPLPGQVVPLGAPSMRPGEPLTAGMDLGAGPGASALGPLNGGGDDTSLQLRAIYSRFPNEDLRRIIEMLDTDDGTGLR